jgi:serine/threonine protein kinase
MSSSPGRPLDADLWRRIGVVLDRMHDADPARATEILAEACAAEGLTPQEVERYLIAERESAARPEQIDQALLDSALRALAVETHPPVLSPGEHLGHYEIVETLGSGGMAEVYRARDTRLGRSVAIKILQTHFATRSDGRARFEREARAISALNHPHICTLHDVGRYERPTAADDGDREALDYLVMELLQGETLASRIARGPLPIAEVLQHGAEIAEALAAAHRAGITHRDLKPANVMLTAHGVKLLDFGVAALRPAGGALVSATNTALTSDGAIVGTLNYMAPEQLQGKTVDGRADLFALGAIVHEMLTGRQPFAADSAAGIVAAILERDPPPLSADRPGVPPTLERSVARCLARSPDDRWQSAADLAAHLKSIDPSPVTESFRESEDSRLHGESVRREPIDRAQRRRALTWTMASLGLAAIGLVAYFNWPREPAPAAAPYRFAIPPPDGTRYERVISISPDGRRIAFTAIDSRDTRTLWVRPLDALGSQRIDGTEGALYPFWSPDGREIAFFANNKLKRVELATGRVQIICDGAGLGGGGSWNADGTILFASQATLPATRIQRVSAAGGPATPITHYDGLGLHSWPHFLPDGRHFLHLRIQQGESGIYVGRPERDEPTPIITAPVKELLDDRLERENSRGVYASGQLFFVRGRALMAQPFDPSGFTLSGEAVRLADAIDTNAPGVASFDASSSGVLAYIAPPVRDTVQLTWFDRQGHEVGRLGDAGPYRTFAISRDGRAVLADREDMRLSEPRSVVRFDVGQGTSTPVRRAGTYPVWNPDGTRFAHRGGAGRPLIRITATDGSDSDGKGLGVALNAYPGDWSLDGRFLVGTAIRPQTSSRDLFAVEIATGTLTFPVESRLEETDPQLSPDGNWLAYAVADESNQWDVYVRSFGRQGGVWRVSRRGGRFPRWTDNGRGLFYVQPDGTLTRAAIALQPSSVTVTSQEDLFRLDALTYEYNLPTPSYPYDVAGNRFLVRVPIEIARPQPINVVLNWESLVRR